jgi:ubiquinone/menaquinone biosynthesis C-methylase UbiE
MMRTDIHYQQEREFWDKKGSGDYVSLSAYDQQRVADWLGWNGNGRVLDLGGGAGMLSRLLMMAPGSECVCLDISHNMLKHSPVPAVQANALKLPFADGSFDLVVAAAFLHHIPGLEHELMHECARVLVPGGRVVGYDPNAHCIQNRIFMNDTPFRLGLFSPDERPLWPDALSRYTLSASFSDFTYRTFSFRNERLTMFEFIQRYVLNPVSIGPLQKYLDRWFFWSASK